MKKYLIIIILLIPSFVISQSNKKKWLDNIRLDIRMSYEKQKHIYEEYSNHGTVVDNYGANYNYAGIFADLNYRNRYFKFSIQLSRMYSITQKLYFSDDAIYNSFSIGNNILCFINKPQLKQWYFGPKIEVANFPSGENYPWLCYGMELYYKNYYIGVSKCYLMNEKGELLDKRTSVFISAGYSFNKNNFKKNILQQNEKKWFDNLYLDLLKGFGQHISYYINYPINQNSPPFEDKRIVNYSQDVIGLGYKNKYFKAEFNSSVLIYNSDWNILFDKMMNLYNDLRRHNIIIGINFLGFSSNSVYFGPLTGYGLLYRINCVYDEKYPVPLINYGMEIYYKGIHIQFEKQRYIRTQAIKKSFWFLNVGYSFSMQNFKNL